MDVWAAKFNQTQIAKATGVQRNRMAMWLTRGHIRYAETDGDADTGVGVAHQISARTALRIALTDLVSPFIDAAKAADAVAVFMDHGIGAHPANPITRSPGELFDDGETVLCIYAEGDAEVLQLTTETSALQLPGLRDGRRFALFPLNEMHATVLGRLERMAGPPFETTTPQKSRRKAKADA